MPSAIARRLPTAELSLPELEALIEREGPETIAAVIAEPVAIPGAVKIPHSDYFKGLRKICDAHGILLIIDEVVCGFGRTGKMFGAEHFGVKGDIVTYAKGLTSGYIPMGAVAVSGAGQRGVPRRRRSSTSTPMPAIRSPAPRRWLRST